MALFSLFEPPFSLECYATLSPPLTLPQHFVVAKRFYHSPLSQLQSEKQKAAHSSVWELPSEILKQNFRIGS